MGGEPAKSGDQLASSIEATAQEGQQAAQVGPMKNLRKTLVLFPDDDAGVALEMSERLADELVRRARKDIRVVQLRPTMTS